MRALTDVSAPGFDEEIKESLTKWGISGVTDVQERAFAAGVAVGESLVVCAPTSSGKTLVGEIAVLQALRASRRSLYLVSHKALADQKFEDFRERFESETANPAATVALSTGDRDEGDLQGDILIATYEKGLALVLSGQIEPHKSLIVADELQIIGEDGRGPNIEILCTVLLQKNISQLVALTATVENPEELADWLQCKLVQSYTRDVELHQEIWYQGSGYGITFGQEDGGLLNPPDGYPYTVPDAVNFLIKTNRTPVLVFTESRREASQYANSFASSRQRFSHGIEVAEQLDLFSEPTETSEALRKLAEKRVAFHTADLAPQERQVIEQEFIYQNFEVCFATSTLAAGVNFPFRTVLFSKLTYQYGDRRGMRMKRSDYRNMSGRAGRLGMHDSGYAVLIPQDLPENKHAQKLLLPENDRVYSKFATLSMRRSVLMLVDAKMATTTQTLINFLEHTYYWYLTLERNPDKLQEVIANAKHALKWLCDNDLIEKHDGTYLSTPFGHATARSGLLPTTACAFAKILKLHLHDVNNNFTDLIGGIIYWTCGSDEFVGETASRFLPYPIDSQPTNSVTFVSGYRLFDPIDRSDSRLCKCVHALILFVGGHPERHIVNDTHISSGNIHRLAGDVSWMLDGLHSIAAVPNLKCPQSVGNNLSLLSRRIRWGAPAEAIDFIRIAQKSRVPGFGRQRAMSLLQNGFDTFEKIINAGIEKLSKILKNRQRAEEFLKATAESGSSESHSYVSIHFRLAKKLSISEIVSTCENTMHTEYEEAVAELLRRMPSCEVILLDDGKRQNVPDLLVKIDGLPVLIEIKTTAKSTGLKKEEAFAVQQKAADFSDEMHRVTLGKPRFDETSKSKAMASHSITLVEHSVFLEAVLRVLDQRIEPKAFHSWITQPGIAEMERIPGNPTYMQN